MAGCTLPVQEPFEVPPSSTWPAWGGTGGKGWHQATPGEGTKSLAALHSHDIPPTHGAALSAAIGDVDGDGLSDVVYSTTAFLPDQRPSLFIQGTRSLAPRILIEGPRGLSPPVLVDVDGDGALDIFYAYGRTKSMVSTLRGVLWQAAEGGSVCGPTCAFPTLANLTVDQVPDILIASAGGDPAILAFDGARGELLWRKNLPCGWMTTPMVVMDAERTTSIIVGCESAGMDGNLGGARVFSFRAPPSEDTHGAVQEWEADLLDPATMIPASGKLHALTSGNLLAGEMGIAAALHGPHAVVLLDKHGTIRDVYLAAEWDQDTFPLLLGAADLDGDGLDEIIESSARDVRAYSVKDGKLQIAWRAAFDERTTGSSFATSDLDGDGLVELVVGLQVGPLCGEDSMGRVVVLDAHGETISTPWTGGACAQPTLGLAIGDINGDGAHEVAVPAGHKFLLLTTAAEG